MQVKCTSCGAINSISQPNSSIPCVFCGAIMDSQVSSINKSDYNIVKCEIRDREVKYINRGINNIKEIVGLYSDNEIEKINKLTLNNNNIKSLIGVSHFTLYDLNVSNNNISIIDEIPSLGRRGSLLFLNFRNNPNLTDISEDVINKFNSFNNIQSIHLYFKGCSKFNYAKLSEINFKELFTKELGVSARNPKVIIEPEQNIEMPLSLKEMGFIQSISENDTDGYFIKNIAERNRIEWVLEIQLLQKLVQDLSSNKDLKKETKSGCFIATAAMGDYNHPLVIDLRLFRDNWLIKRNWGVNFTNWYYTHGPKAARIIEKSLCLKKLTFIFIVKPLQLLTKKLR